MTCEGLSRNENVGKWWQIKYIWNIWIIIMMGCCLFNNSEITKKNGRLRISSSTRLSSEKDFCKIRIFQTELCLNKTCSDQMPWSSNYYIKFKSLGNVEKTLKKCCSIGYCIWGIHVTSAPFWLLGVRFFWFAFTFFTFLIPIKS